MPGGRPVAASRFDDRRQPFSDPADDTGVVVPHGQSSESRQFKVPASITPGNYTTTMGPAAENPGVVQDSHHHRGLRSVDNQVAASSGRQPGA
jgi:hypothetical protein